MLASLEKAIKAEEPIVVTLWRPHWAFAKYPIRALEDPEEAFGGADIIQTAANKKFADRVPEAASIISNFELTSEQLGELEIAIQEADDAAEGARAWIADNQELVDGWLEG